MVRNQIINLTPHPSFGHSTPSSQLMHSRQKPKAKVTTFSLLWPNHEKLKDVPWVLNFFVGKSRFKSLILFNEPRVHHFIKKEQK